MRKFIKDFFDPFSDLNGALLKGMLAVMPWLAAVCLIMAFVTTCGRD